MGNVGSSTYVGESINVEYADNLEINYAKKPLHEVYQRDDDSDAETPPPTDDPDDPRNAIGGVMSLRKAPRWLLEKEQIFRFEFEGDVWELIVQSDKKTLVHVSKRRVYLDSVLEPKPSFIIAKSKGKCIAPGKLDALVNVINAKLNEWREAIEAGGYSWTNTDEEARERRLEQLRLVGPVSSF